MTSRWLFVLLVAGCGRIGFDADAGFGVFAIAESPTPPCRVENALTLDGIGAGLDRQSMTMSISIAGHDAQSCIGKDLPANTTSVEIWMRATTDACGLQPCDVCDEPFAEVYAGPTAELDTLLYVRQEASLDLDVFTPYAFVISPGDRVVVVCRQSTGGDRLDVELDAILPIP
jgi:hypothetical protein